MVFLSNSFSVGTGAHVTGLGSDWASPTNIQASDASRSTVILTSVGNTSDLLRCTNFSFSNHIPVGATILGVQVALEWGLTAGSAGDAQILAFQLWDGSSTLGSDQGASQNVPASEVIELFGDSSDLWGGTRATITSTVVRASGFGVQLSVDRTNDSTIGVDHVTMSIWWRLPRGRNRGRER